ncbi:MAG TPA: 50S ribosomal protein L25/general stress protein Ctc [Halothiobacillaceae bacterium]|nr:50S ribosomal protein L25/general stress protein Ctc [Halothiobacillaceae bacterium]
MSNQTFTIEASARDDLGKGASRRLRRQGYIPAIVYGGKKAPQPLTINHNELLKHLDHEAFFSHVLDLVVDGKKETVILRDLHRHPFKTTVVMHADFQRVSAHEKLRMNVPLHFENRTACKGVKSGGIINVIYNELEIECAASDLPEYIEVDLIDLDINESVHMSEIKLPKGVSIPALAHGDDYDSAVVAILPPQKESIEDAEEASDADDGENTEEAGEAKD